jgi:Tc toxin complex TcA C-terminal TcB-binding domain
MTHSAKDQQTVDKGLSQLAVSACAPEFTYDFSNFFHPFVGELITKLNKDSLSGLLDPVYQKGLTDPTFFSKFYSVLAGGTSFKVEHHPKEIDISTGGPYANYNWELFFHVPLTIAVHLSKNQRFAEAQRWFHYIFDPTSNDTSVPSPQRFWKFLAFRYDADTSPIDQQLVLLSTPNDEVKDLAQKQAVVDGYEAIKNNPFHPHVVARNRPLAYQYCVVMKYLDNLIAWGDSLFRQDTIESINEATQIYVLAANLLGERPQRIPPRGAVGAKSFKQLKEQGASGIDPMGNALVKLEGEFPSLLTDPQGQGPNQDLTGPLFGIGRTLYFCVPPNEKLLGYWDTVADRLFKIRHCMNIEGVVRQLALFDPPIDPGMLVKAAAAGIDIGSIVSGLNQPLGPVRCTLLIQKALELCGEVRGLGAALLSALEKGDGEHLALLRQGHEINIQQTMQETRFLQWKQAQESTASLLTTRATALERLRYYQRLLGLPRDANAPDSLPLDRRELNEENFDDAYGQLVGQYDKTVTLQNLPQLKRAGDSSPTVVSGFSGSGKVHLSENEDTELNVHLPVARDARLVASAANAVASSLTPIPDADVKGHFWGIGVSATVTGGQKLAIVAKIVAEIAQLTAAFEHDQAELTSRYASYERRADEWLLQHNLVAHELMQIGRQILTSLIAEQIAHRDYLNTKQQIANAQEVNEYLQGQDLPGGRKFTTENLYLWMQGEISRLYYEYYRFAFDIARKAERTMKQEVMRPELDAQDFVKFNYWDGGRKGLLSGEALYLDLKRMEMAYHENNKREFELTKHVSLRQLTPLALLSLKATGTCEFTVPEWLFDLDGSLYMRRIKTVGLSIPSVTGPYTSVSCTLSLLKSSVRKSSLLSDDGYARAGSEDSRFVDYHGTIQQIVTSSGNNDTGMFETNLRDERFLPFEGAGAISTWKLELPASFRQFDYNTISDVILHMRYTARQGGTVLSGEATKSIEEFVADAKASGLALLFSLPHEFPNEWHKFTATGSAANFEATVRRDHFPYLTQGRDIQIGPIQLHAIDVQTGKMKSPVTLADIPEVILAANAQTEAEKKFSISLDPTQGTVGDVLKRDKEAQVFLVINYSLES